MSPRGLYRSEVCLLCALSVALGSESVMNNGGALTCGLHFAFTLPNAT